MIFTKAKILKIFSALVVLFISPAVFFNCSTSIDLIKKVRRIEFKLGNVSNFRIAGVNFANKKSITDFSISEGSKLSEALAAKKFPVSFTLNILAKNPNDGTGGTVNLFAVITGFKWKLLINNRETIRGNIENEIVIPSSFKETVIPIKINLDFKKFFPDLGYDSLLNIGFSIGGAYSSASKIILKATPTIETSIGPLVSEEITIVDREFR